MSVDKIQTALDALVEAVDAAGFEAVADEIMACSDELDGWPDWAEALLDQVRSAVRATEALHAGRAVLRLDKPGGEGVTYEVPQDAAQGFDAAMAAAIESTA